VRRSPEEFLEDLLRGFCPQLQREERNGKVLLFCEGSLLGSAVRLEDRTALTVYSERSRDPIHSELLRRARETFGDLLMEGGTHTSSGLEGVFYYTYVHVKL
jgi:hypothetical protein